MDPLDEKTIRTHGPETQIKVRYGWGTLCRVFRYTHKQFKHINNQIESQKDIVLPVLVRDGH